MEHPYGEQYSQEGNPRAYMTMRDYRNLPYQWQQPLGRNPNPPRSMREYRDQWMSAPVYSVPSTYPPPPQYDHPEPPFYASTPQSPQQQPPPLSPIEQAILNLSKVVGTFVEEQKILHVQTNQRIEAVESSVNRKLDNMHAEISKLSNQQLQSSEKEKAPFQRQQYQNMVTIQANQETETVESSLNKKLDGFQSASDQKLDIQEESILKLTNQFVHPEEENLEEESQEDECLTETILVEQAQLQPQEELEVELVKAPEDLQDAPVNFWPWTNEEQNTAWLTEKSSGHEGTQEPIIQPNPVDLDTTATAQATKYPLPVAPSDD